MWRSLTLVAVAGLAATFFPSRGGSTTTPPLALETAAWSRGSCALCHEVPKGPQASRSEGCASCHEWIREVSTDPRRRAEAMTLFPLWEQYEDNVHSYLAVPDLDAAMARLEPSWVRAYLEDPYDTRPGMAESMPRFGLNPAEIDAIVAGFARRKANVPQTTPPSLDNLDRGAAIFQTRGCSSCHAFGGNYPRAPLPLAPDLAHARDRMDPDMAAAWIIDPSAISSTATMPSLGLTLDEAVAVRDYLWLADLDWQDTRETSPPPVPVDRPVRWEEVQSRVFGKICVHCHMDPSLNEGRGGPGHDGGFGHAASEVVLETWEGTVSALPKLEGVLLARRHEARRDAVAAGMRPESLTRPAVSGMPMGHPPISDEDLSLVLGWIEQGAPR